MFGGGASSRLSDLLDFGSLHHISTVTRYAAQIASARRLIRYRHSPDRTTLYASTTSHQTFRRAVTPKQPSPPPPPSHHAIRTMPPPSSTNHLPSSHPAQRQRPKSPTRVLAETEAQWIFSEAELANTPSIQDGMPLAEEREKRASAINFMIQVGIMLKLPQLTLSTAAVFFHRFMMRASFKKERSGIPKLHHFQAAATALFLATKVEESCRKMKELVLSFCRVAQKNPNLIIDEQSKDWWRWRDCILHNEDVLLETLCFDLTVESPHRQLFDMLKFYGVEHNKKLRNAAWSFVTDINNTPICLMVSSRAIAVASLYAALRHCGETIHDDSRGRPWWEAQNIKLKDIRTVITHLVSHYDPATEKFDGVSVNRQSAESGNAIYVGLSSSGAADNIDESRLKSEQGAGSQSPYVPSGRDRRVSNASSMGAKRERETNGEAQTNGVHPDERETKRARPEETPTVNGTEGLTVRDTDAMNDLKHEEEQIRVRRGNEEAEMAVAERPHEQAPEGSNARGQVADVAMSDAQQNGKADEAEASEEGEIEE